MSILDYFVNLSLSVILIVGAYQFYFWCQRRTAHRAVTLPCSALENRIRKRVEWVWVYSGLYYPMILLANIAAFEMRHFNYIAFSYLLLLAMQMAAFLLFPVKTPDSWRKEVNTETTSQRFLKFVQRFDDASNCFPSMHVSVATLTALHVALAIPTAVPWIWSFPILIATSAVFTRQHYLVDLAPGALLGWLAFRAFLAIY